MGVACCEAVRNTVNPAPPATCDRNATFTVQEMPCTARSGVRKVRDANYLHSKTLIDMPLRLTVSATLYF